LKTDTLHTQWFVAAHMESAVDVPVEKGRVAVISRRSPDRSGDPNEDAAAVISVPAGGVVLAVADGVGGQSSGAEASRLALEAIETSLRSRPPEDELRTAILNGFEMANETVRALGVGAGTTLAVVEVQGEWIRPYHVGDSGIVVTGQRGKVRVRTVDHSPTGYAVEAGLMNDRQAIRHEERHLLTNMVGSESMRIEIGSSVQLAPRDTIVMASDGLFDNVHFDEIVDRIRSGPLDKRVDELASLASRRMTHETATRPSKPDDLTIVAFRRAAPHPSQAARNNAV